MRLIKVLVAILIIGIVVKYTLPRLKRHSTPATTDTHASCGAAAARASETWGSGLRRFVNPPYDIAAWGDFRGSVDAQISAADSACNCGTPSCDSVRGALRDLRNLVGEFDTAIRNGSSPPSDAVQRQEAIDDTIAAAK